MGASHSLASDARERHDAEFDGGWPSQSERCSDFRARCAEVRQVIAEVQWNTIDEPLQG